MGSARAPPPAGVTPDHSAARRVATGTLANVFGKGTVLLVGIVLAPIILHFVGATNLGIWIVIDTVGSFAFLVEMGISAGLIKYVAEHAARGEDEEAAEMVGAATWLFALLGSFVAIAGILLALALAALVDLHGRPGEVVPPLAAITAVDVGITILALPPATVLKGLQRFPLANAIMATGAVVGGLLVVAALAAGLGIVGAAAAQALNSVLTYAASLVITRRTVPSYMAVPIRRDSSRVRRLIRFSRSVAVVQVAVHMQTRLDSIVIAAALPIRFVTPYGFAQRLASGTEIATDQFAKVLLPFATEVSATREPGALKALYLSATRLTLAIALGVGLPLALLGGPILELWVGDAYSGYGPLVVLLVCAAIIDLPTYPAAALLQSIERHGPIAWMALGTGVLNLGLSIAFVGPYGLEGVATATLLASAVEITVFVVPYAARVLGVSWREFASEVVLPLLLPGAVLAALVIAGSAILPVTSLVRLAVVVGVAVTGYLFAYARVGASPHERSVYRAALSAGTGMARRLRGRRARRTERSS
jgi:O-antigen/teichoic acid export membrane protein